ncbi:MAG: LptE family protein [Phycisphaerales bacterium]|nr:LptE family protein [Phycisphaerales bacterium]
MTKYLAFCALLLSILCSACGVYSFTGASVEGKTINFHILDNKARNVMPALSATLTTKIRNRILSQTGLSPVNTDDADYDISGYITAYDVSVTGVQNTQTASLNRLTISVQIEFKNQKNTKASFSQSFSRFSDFAANQALQTVENKLIEEIGTQLADDIFNKAFVNW